MEHWNRIFNFLYIIWTTKPIGFKKKGLNTSNSTWYGLISSNLFENSHLHCKKRQIQKKIGPCDDVSQCVSVFRFINQKVARKYYQKKQYYNSKNHVIVRELVDQRSSRANQTCLLLNSFTFINEVLSLAIASGTIYIIENIFFKEHFSLIASTFKIIKPIKYISWLKTNRRVK